MVDIRDILEMVEPTPETISTLSMGNYIVRLKSTPRTKQSSGRKACLIELKFVRYATVPPKFINLHSHQRFTVEDIDYIFKLKTNESI